MKIFSTIRILKSALVTSGMCWLFGTILSRGEYLDMVSGKRLKLSLSRPSLVPGMTYSTASTRCKSSLNTYNCYKLFGVDILLDDKLKPWLLEVNNYPSLCLAPIDRFEFNYI